MKIILKSFLMIMAILFLSKNVFAQEKTMQAIAQPMVAKIGFYITDLYELNLPGESFQFVGYMWWDVNPINSTYIPYKNTDLINSQNEQMFSVLTANKKQGYFQAKVTGKVNKQWDLRRYPFDVQTLHIRFEDTGFDVRALRYIADTKNSGVSPDIVLDDWIIKGHSIYTTHSKYQTNFGEPGVLTEVPYDRLVFAIQLERKNSGYLFFYLFIGAFVSAILCILGFFTRIGSEIRFNLFLGSIFAAIGNQYILFSTLPRTTYFTLCDKIQTITYILLTLTAISNIVMKRYLKESKKFRRNLNLAIASCLAFGYVLAVASQVLLALV